MKTLLIGGVYDGKKEMMAYDEDTYQVYEMPPLLWTYNGIQDRMEPVKHIYYRMEIAGVKFYRHESLSETDAVYQLIKRYRKR
jgi:hypothetical protein